LPYSISCSSSAVVAAAGRTCSAAAWLCRTTPGEQRWTARLWVRQLRVVPVKFVSSSSRPNIFVVVPCIVRLFVMIVPRNSAQSTNLDNNATSMRASCNRSTYRRHVHYRWFYSRRRLHSKSIGKHRGWPGQSLRMTVNYCITSLSTFKCHRQRYMMVLIITSALA